MDVSKYNKYTHRLPLMYAYRREAEIQMKDLDAWFTKCEKSGVRYVYIYVSVKYPGDDSRHATYLWFDLRNRVQMYFDPHMKVSPYMEAMQMKAFRPGYVTAPVWDLILDPLLYPDGLQEVLESESNTEGLCAAWSLLFWMSCSRFEYYHYRTVAELILEIFKTPNQRIGLVKRFLTLYCASPSGIPPAKVFAPANQCMAFRKRTHTFCEKRPDGNSMYCRSHARQYVQ
jgi:hypothetical protein